jgi:hypothetical protein
MQSPVTQEQWTALTRNGHTRMPGAFRDALPELDEAVGRLLGEYPHGTTNPPLWTGIKPARREQAPKPSDYAPTVIIRDVAFLEPTLMRPLANPQLHDLVERVCGKDFLMSNTWFQMVPPGTGRLSYHKDPRGGISINVLLDDIETKSGSTCLVERTHVNTPPPSYCMQDIRAPHPHEVNMIGERGDLIISRPIRGMHARKTKRRSGRGGCSSASSAAAVLRVRFGAAWSSHSRSRPPRRFCQRPTTTCSASIPI